jgi:hypothetical protein
VAVTGKTGWAVVTLALTVLLVGGATGVANAETADGARLAIARAAPPGGLYPAYFPALVGPDTRADQRIRGRYYYVTWTACCDSRTGGQSFILSFARGPRRDLQATLKVVRAQRHHYRRTTIGGRRVFAFRGDVTFGYTWIEGGTAYLVESHYFLPEDAPRDTVSDIVASAAPVGHVL